MNITTAKKPLLAALKRARDVADRKATMPILANALLTAEGDTLRIDATNLRLAVTSRVEAEVTKPGAICVPLQDLADRVAQMPDGPVQIAVGKNSTVTVKAVGTARKYTMHAMPGSDYPDVPRRPDDAAPFSVTGSVLASLIDRAGYAISADESRMSLHSALLELGGGALRMVATDGHRLVRAEAPCDGDKATLLVPLGGVKTLRALAATAGDDAVSIATQGAWLYAAHGDVSIAVQLADATFPPYEAVIPSRDPRPVTVPRLQFLAACRAVAVAASDRTSGITVELNGALRIKASDPESGEAIDEVAVDYDGPERSAGFNARYLVEALGAIEGDEVLLDIADALDPATLRPCGDGAVGDVSVLMPMRI